MIEQTTHEIRRDKRSCWAANSHCGRDEPLLADELMDELQGIGAVPIGPAPSVDAALQALADGPNRTQPC